MPMHERAQLEKADLDMSDSKYFFNSLVLNDRGYSPVTLRVKNIPQIGDTQYVVIAIELVSTA